MKNLVGVVVGVGMMMGGGGVVGEVWGEDLIKLASWTNAPVSGPVVGNVGFGAFSNSASWTYSSVTALGGVNYDTTGFFAMGYTNAIAMFGFGGVPSRAWTGALRNSHPTIPVLVRFEWSWKVAIPRLTNARRVEMVHNVTQASGVSMDQVALWTGAVGWQTCSILRRVYPGEVHRLKFNCYDGVGALAGVRYVVVPDLVPGGADRLGVAGDGWLIIPPGREVQRTYSIDRFTRWETVRPYQPWQNGPMEYWRLKPLPMVIGVRY